MRAPGRRRKASGNNAAALPQNPHEGRRAYGKIGTEDGGHAAGFLGNAKTGVCHGCAACFLLVFLGSRLHGKGSRCNVLRDTLLLCLCRNLGWRDRKSAACPANLCGRAGLWVSVYKALCRSRLLEASVPSRLTFFDRGIIAAFRRRGLGRRPSFVQAACPPPACSSLLLPERPAAQRLLAPECAGQNLFSPAVPEPRPPRQKLRRLPGKVQEAARGRPFLVGDLFQQTWRSHRFSPLVPLAGKSLRLFAGWRFGRRSFGLFVYQGFVCPFSRRRILPGRAFFRLP